MLSIVDFFLAGGRGGGHQGWCPPRGAGGAWSCAALCGIRVHMHIAEANSYQFSWAGLLGAWEQKFAAENWPGWKAGRRRGAEGVEALTWLGVEVECGRALTDVGEGGCRARRRKVPVHIMAEGRGERRGEKGVGGGRGERGEGRGDRGASA